MESLSFYSEIKDRLKMPWKHSAFNAYFVIIFILFGGLGTGISIYEECSKTAPILENVSHNIATAFVAVIAACLVDINLSVSFKNIPTLVIYSIGFVGLSILLLFLTYRLSGVWSFAPSIIGYLISILVWVLANADNEKLNDQNFYKKMMKKANELSSDW